MPVKSYHKAICYILTRQRFPVTIQKGYAVADARLIC